MDLIQSKKMIFSAVALVAFSFTGMANDGTVEECSKTYKEVKDGHIANGVGEQEAIKLARAAYHKCRSTLTVSID